MLDMAGGGRDKTFKAHVRSWKQKAHLVCKAPNGVTSWIPLVRQHDYLGCVIGYHGAATATIQRRLTAAKHTFNKLRHVLHAYRTHSLQARLRLYYACVWHTLSYSTLEVGLHEHGAQQVHGLVMRQLRSISQSPVHITRESNDTLLHRIRRPFALDYLTTAWAQKVQSWQGRRTNLEEGDATLVIPRYPPLCKAMNGKPCSERRQPREIDVAQQSQCPQCPMVFTTHHALRQHLRASHGAGLRKFNASLFKAERDAQPGAWNCRRCGLCLQDRRSLKSHIGFGTCPSFSSAAPDTHGGILSQPKVRQLANPRGVEHLLRDKAMCVSMCKYCVQCGGGSLMCPRPGTTYPNTTNRYYKGEGRAPLPIQRPQHTCQVSLLPGLRPKRAFCSQVLRTHASGVPSSSVCRA